MSLSPDLYFELLKFKTYSNIHLCVREYNCSTVHCCTAMYCCLFPHAFTSRHCPIVITLMPPSSQSKQEVTSTLQQVNPTIIQYHINFPTSSPSLSSWSGSVSNNPQFRKKSEIPLDQLITWPCLNQWNFGFLFWLTHWNRLKYSQMD